MNRFGLIKPSIGIGQRVRYVGVNSIKKKKLGTVAGYNYKSFRDGRECYYVLFDNQSKNTREAYHVDFLEKIPHKSVTHFHHELTLKPKNAMGYSFFDEFRHMWS